MDSADFSQKHVFSVQRVNVPLHGRGPQAEVLADLAHRGIDKTRMHPDVGQDLALAPREAIHSLSHNAYRCDMPPSPVYARIPGNTGACHFDTQADDQACK